MLTGPNPEATIQLQYPEVHAKKEDPRIADMSND
jgi:hypothetical protein